MKKILLVLAAATLMPLTVAAQSSESWLPEDMRVTAGVRFWHTDWSSWFGENSIYLHAGVETTVIPVVSVRYKDFLLSGSYLLEKDFDFPVVGAPASGRKEYDVTAGYFILPGLAVAVGYKQIDYQADAYRWRGKGLTVGLSGSAPLAPWTSLYGNLAYGRLKIQDQYAFDDARGKYLLTEFGLAFPLGAVEKSLQGFVVTVGYRYQRTGAYPNGDPGLPRDRELFEYTQGPVLGVSFTL